MAKKLFILLIVFFVAIIGFWLWRESMFSKEILRVEILGPEHAKVGEEIEYTVKYKNNGNFVLENPKINFSMPENSLTEDGRTLVMQELNDIYPGGEDVFKVKTRLLGKEGDVKTARASLSYTPKNLTARYESTTKLATIIEEVPITLDFDLPSKVEKGKDLQYLINYFSNVDYPLEKLSLRVDKVDGFSFISSDPKSLDNSEWKLPTLNKAQGGRVKIKGNVSSDLNKKINFSASLGMWQNGEFVIIKQANKEVEVIEPLLVISQEINGSNNYIASAGEVLHYQISFTNIGSSSFENLFAIIRLDGQALDMSTISAEGGQVQPNDNMIVFNSSQLPQLRRLDTQQTGQISFDVKVKSNWTPTSSDEKSSLISDEVNISQIIQKFSIKVNAGLVINQTAKYQSDDIPNSGSTPPKVGKSTTYTISWNIKNYSSDQKNVKVKAILPKNVSLTGKIMPQGENQNFSFDSASREVVWSAGDVLAGTGVKGDPITLSFQASLTPDASQKGLLAQIIESVIISGENQFTNTIITAQDTGINTSLPDDPSNSGGGLVQ